MRPEDPSPRGEVELGSLLVVDDDADVTRLFERLARGVGFQTRAVNEGGKLDSVLDRTEADVILLDLEMPGVDGVELLRHLAERGCQASIYLISGVDSRILDTAVRLGRDMGLAVCDAIQKPVDVRRLRDRLMRHQRMPVALATPDDTMSEHALARALRNDQIYACYQPQVRLLDGEVRGFEALVRWRHPELGVIPPGRFIPTAEACGLVGELTHRVLEVSLYDFATWRGGANDLVLAVNLSPRLLTNLDLPNRIEEMLREESIPASSLTLEVTETGAMEDPSRSMEILSRLRLKQINLSIDDFGTGSSSLVHLYRLPFRELKVDRSFVAEAMKKAEAEAIVKATIELAHSLGLAVVAEGIENRETYEWLARLGCGSGQGYYIAPPLEPEEVPGWLDRWQNRDRKRAAGVASLA